MALHIHGPLSQTRKLPRHGTEGPQGQLISQQSHGSGFWIAPPHLFYVCDAPAPTLVNGSVPAIARCKEHIANILIGSKISKKWLEISSNVAINNNLLLLWYCKPCCIYPIYINFVVFSKNTVSSFEKKFPINLEVMKLRQLQCMLAA